MLELNIQWTQHALGVGHDILEEPTKPIPPSIGDTWTQGVHNFCINAGCSVLVPSLGPPTPRCERDITIMDLAMQHNLMDVQLRSIQKVCLYLGITSCLMSAMSPEMLYYLTFVLVIPSLCLMQLSSIRARKTHLTLHGQHSSNSVSYKDWTWVTGSPSGQVTGSGTASTVPPRITIGTIRMPAANGPAISMPPAKSASTSSSTRRKR
jgi:hypothetical protein